MNIVCFGQQNWDVCWSAKQHLLTRLARRGHRVLYVDPIPDVGHTSAAGKLKALAPAATGLGLREEHGVHIFTPPWAHLLPDRVNRARRRALVGKVAQKLGMSGSVAICMWPAQRWMIDGIKPAARVYFAVDDNASFGGLDPEFAEMQRREEQRLLAESDLALGVSDTLLERFRKIQPRSYLQENGVSLIDFDAAAKGNAAPHAVLASLPRPRVGFVGQIDDRMDQELVAAVARWLRSRSKPGEVVLVGRVKQGVKVAALKREPNVHLIGFVPYEQLAGVYRELDVGIVPYVKSPLTQACNPLKVYEYLAADLPTVATDLAGLNTTREAISVAGDHASFIAAVEQALEDRSRGREARRRVAEAASWDRRSDLLESRLQEALEIAAGRGAVSSYAVAADHGRA
jgi:glycosyltransferase involved in cell wall biosynthesis